MDRGTAFFTVRGFSLIEVMLAGFIISTGMLAMVRMQTAALIQVHNNQQMLQADWLVDDLIARIRINPDGFNHLTLDAIALMHSDGVAQASAACSMAQWCTPEQIASDDVSRWFKRVHDILPGASISFEELVHGVQTHARLWQLELRWESALAQMQANVSTGRFVL